MESAVKQRLIAFINYLGLSKNAFEVACGLSKRYVSNISVSISPSVIEKISLKFPQLNKSWLLTGEGEMLKSAPSVQQNNTYGNNNYNNGVQLLPARGSAQEVCPECRQSNSEIIVVEDAQRPIIPSEWACKPDFDVIEEVFKNPDKVDKSRFIVLDNPVDIWIEVRDDSLEPRAYRGDRLGLLIYPKGQEDPIWGKFHAVDTWTNGIIVRKLYPAEGGYRCVSPNNEFPDIFICKENIISVSRVVYVVRKAL